MTSPHLVHEIQIEQLRESLEQYMWVTSDRERKMIRRILREWGEIANAIDTALINHRYRLLTFVITVDREALFIEFVRDKNTKEWIYKSFRLGERGGWPYKWEYRVGEGLVERTIKVKEVPRL